MVLLFIARFFDQTFHLPDIVLGFMYAFLIGTDSISILENLSKLGFNVPIRLVKYLEVFIEKKEKNLKDMLEK
jgi:phage-related holin